MPIYIIEHLEPELYPWCLLEYKSISKIVSSRSVWFTNIKHQDASKLKKYGKVFIQSIKKLKLNKACILDPEAPRLLQPNEKFKFFIFGGILGDNPPKKRTREELKLKGERRNIGKSQFSTDNAVYVVKQIVSGKKFSEIKFQNEIEIKTGKYDSIILPYLYPLVNGKPKISKELVKYIKKHQGF